MIGFAICRRWIVETLWFCIDSVKSIKALFLDPWSITYFTTWDSRQIARDMIKCLLVVEVHKIPVIFLVTTNDLYPSDPVLFCHTNQIYVLVSFTQTKFMFWLTTSINLLFGFPPFLLSGSSKLSILILPWIHCPSSVVLVQTISVQPCWLFLQNIKSWPMPLILSIQGLLHPCQSQRHLCFNFCCFQLCLLYFPLCHCI